MGQDLHQISERSATWSNDHWLDHRWPLFEFQSKTMTDRRPYLIIDGSSDLRKDWRWVDNHRITDGTWLPAIWRRRRFDQMSIRMREKIQRLWQISWSLLIVNALFIKHALVLVKWRVERNLSVSQRSNDKREREDCCSRLPNSRLVINAQAGRKIWTRIGMIDYGWWWCMNLTSNLRMQYSINQPFA